MKVVNLLRLLLGPLNIRVVGPIALLLARISHILNSFQKYVFNPSCLLPLHNDANIVKMFKFNHMFCHAYVFQCTKGGDGFICPTSHWLEDVALSQPLVRSNHASLVIDDVIRSTPEYQPRQICKDFVRQHGIQLTYLQARQLKEKAKERIYGQPKNYYKLLPWMCERMLATNLESSVQLSYSDDGHFERLLGCLPIIAIDSAHMSGPYSGALFSATAYDANDSMFSLAFGVMSSKNYED
ncbi:hypothetical protein AAG906_025642 [Vitis piasezkii]